MTTEERLRLFADGKLTGADLDAFEQQLDDSPALRAALAELVGKPGRKRLFEEEVTVRSEGLSLQRVLGRGGMATVLLGIQHGLEREVAVKMSRRPGNASSRDQLLREARLTGALEHPAIVPVHDLAHSDEGELQVILKRVEGEPWSTLKADRAAVHARFGAELLEWNLRVLGTVASAAAFAHERGVIHRDIKPSNVMIGRFGEVLLMDWGIGGLLSPDPSGRLPHVEAGDGAGTPSYQAPETLAGAAGPLSARTDVYLLGGVLYELLYGAAPFARSTGRHQSEVPTFPDCDQPELAALAKKALSSDPAERHASALEFLRELEVCQHDQHAARLVRRSLQLLERAKEQRARGADAWGRTASEASSVLRTALELSENHHPALDAARQLTTFQVECALADEHPALAAQALEASPTKLPELEERVRRAVSEQQALQQFAKGLDPNVGRHTRVRLLAALVGTTVAFYAIRFALPSLYQGRWALAASSATFVLVIAVMGVVFRRYLATSRLNKQLLGLAALVNGGQLLTRVAAAAIELPRSQALGFELALIATVVLSAAIVHHWSFAVAGGVLIGAQLASLADPAHAERYFAGGMLVAMIILVAIWSSGGWATMTKAEGPNRD